MLAALTLLGLALAPVPALAQGVEDKALGRPAAASSVQQRGEVAGSVACILVSCGPERAVDGSLTTRWSSDPLPLQWWQVDLGRPRLVEEVRVFWHEDYALRYRVGTSLDGVGFQEVTDGATEDGVHVTRFPARPARLVRVTGLERLLDDDTGEFRGFSIYDVGVFGPPDLSEPSSPAVPAQQPVAGAPSALMGPFPVVRIRGSLTRTGARIGLVGVRTPVGARVEVLCRGRGCRRRRATYVSRRGYVRARGFERRLRAGAVLEVIVTQPDTIGKYTRFRIRRGRPPVRTDRCATYGSRQAVACPSADD